MRDHTATLEPEEDKQPKMQQQPPQAEHRPRGGTMKFTYASGSKPLDGFTIKRGVGSGGFGEVFYALSDAGKEVALKHIQRNLDIEMRGVTHCLNLKHPHLVALFDIRYDDAGEGWVVMEYVRGENLKEILDRRPNGLPPEEAIRWFRPIAAAVGYLHDHGIVHRDLKPGNIFNDAGTIKIGDYGLSKFISVSRRSGQTESVGTFHYMAPEIGKGVYGKEIDIYALGILLHEILTGRVPFEGESSQEIIMKHLTAEPELRSVPEPFRSTIAQALHKDPTKRTSTVEEMLANLGVSKNESVVASLHDNVTIQNHSTGHAEIPLVQPLDPAAGSDPIYRAGTEAAKSISHWWNNDNISLFPKVLVLVACSIALVTNLGWLAPLGFLAAAAYMVYLLGRTIYQHMSDAPDKTPVTEYSPYHPVVMTRKERARQSRKQKSTRRERERAALAAIPLDLRMKSLIGSFLVSAISAAVISMLALVLGGVSIEGALDTWAPLFGWMTLMTICGSWSVLLLGKLWEPNSGDPWLRRFAMIGVGLLLGMIGYTAGNTLLLEMPISGAGIDASSGWHENLNLRGWFQSLKQSPSLSTFAIVFAAQFGLLRWWKQADPLRKTRLSLWTMGFSVLIAAVVNYFCPFIQPWGMILIGAISLVVQISAPWYSPKERDELRESQQINAETSA
ncbi:serine/threonine protein kinase [Blastopirellula sp. J2-11]|uniref:serine/threonine-protein kinase n=1 Tax=Blastopirellula sp. J2-11 TaxID=2943192 RepID=UPI0021C7AFB4|nr:serine/threonine-protein kinase [Blastopirellula sp. J2-11]UUO06561.1 serine/threonine protein kinase [Blastopirellula sp. J2-11]